MSGTSIQQQRPRNGQKKAPPNRFRSSGNGKRRLRESSTLPPQQQQPRFRAFSSRGTLSVLGLLLAMGHLWWNSTKMTNLVLRNIYPSTTLLDQQPHAATATTTHTLVVVRCKGNLTWLEGVPSDWTIWVYEKCQDTPSTNHSLLTAKQLGREECNGYLDYLVDFYDRLDDVTVFMHDDGLYPWNRHEDLGETHTPFSNFGQVAGATREFLEERAEDIGFLHLGIHTGREKFGTDSYHGEAMQWLWPYLRTDALPHPPTPPDKRILWKPSAHFAVTREAIHRRPRSTYEALLAQARYRWPTGSRSRKICCALERLWHILFGVDPGLPLQHRAADLLQIRRNQKGGGNESGTVVRLDEGFPAIPLGPYDTKMTNPTTNETEPPSNHVYYAGRGGWYLAHHPPE